MASGIVTKVVGDGNSGTISHRYWCPDTSASPQLLFPAPIITDTSGNPVDFTAASPVTQSGTWTIQPGNTANTTAWKVDNSAVTQPVSIATAPALVAGSALIGKVGIDQTTPGTTNAVSPAGRTYKAVAASATATALGTGATGDVLDGLLIIPATTSPGIVSVLDNSTSMTVFAGGATSVSNLVPFWVPFNSAASVSGAWKITTGANVSIIAVGKFTP